MSLFERVVLNERRGARALHRKTVALHKQAAKASTGQLGNPAWEKAKSEHGLGARQRYEKKRAAQRHKPKPEPKPTPAQSWAQTKATLQRLSPEVFAAHKKANAGKGKCWGRCLTLRRRGLHTVGA